MAIKPGAPRRLLLILAVAGLAIFLGVKYLKAPSKTEPKVESMDSVAPATPATVDAPNSVKYHSPTSAETDEDGADSRSVAPAQRKTVTKKVTAPAEPKPVVKKKDAPTKKKTNERENLQLDNF